MQMLEWLVIGLGAAVWEAKGDVWALVMMMMVVVVDYTAADDVLLGPH